MRTDSGDVPFGEVASETFDDIVGNRNDATLVFTVASLHGPAGNPDDQRFLWGHLDDLRAAIGAQAARPLGDAVAEYVEAISGQHGDRLEALLARPGLGGQDPITDREMARRLGVSDERASQITRRLWHHRDRRRPPAGVWMPQIGEAERDGWPVEYTGAGMEATRGFVG